MKNFKLESAVEGKMYIILHKDIVQYSTMVHMEFNEQIRK